MGLDRQLRNQELKSWFPKGTSVFEVDDVSAPLCLPALAGVFVSRHSHAAAAAGVYDRRYLCGSADGQKGRVSGGIGRVSVA